MTSASSDGGGRDTGAAGSGNGNVNNSNSENGNGTDPLSGGPFGMLTVRLSGTREGVTEARRRLERVVRTVESSLQAPPPLAAALRANNLALTRRIENEFLVRVYLGPRNYTGLGDIGPGGGGGGDHDQVLCDGPTCSGRDGAGRRSGQHGRKNDQHGENAARSGEAARGGEYDSLCRQGEDGVGDAAAVGGSVTVQLSGLPGDVEAATAFMLGLECQLAIVHVESRALPTIIGTAGSNIRKLEVRGWSCYKLLAQGGRGRDHMSRGSHWLVVHEHVAVVTRPAQRMF